MHNVDFKEAMQYLNFWWIKLAWSQHFSEMVSASPENQPSILHKYHWSTLWARPSILYARVNLSNSSCQKQLWKYAETKQLWKNAINVIEPQFWPPFKNNCESTEDGHVFSIFLSYFICLHSWKKNQVNECPSLDTIPPEAQLLEAHDPIWVHLQQLHSILTMVSMKKTEKLKSNN